MLIYKAFGWDTPNFAHISLILAADKSKLSKRHGATSVGEFREKGYLPDAMLNFLSLLGWNDGTEQEIFTQDELRDKFSLKRVNKSAAVFDIEKLVSFKFSRPCLFHLLSLLKDLNLQCLEPYHWFSTYWQAQFPDRYTQLHICWKIWRPHMQYPIANSQSWKVWADAQKFRAWIQILAV